jgi:hypothetical protein
MLGTTAIASGEFEKGKVICFSNHPEKSDGLGELLRHAVQWASPATPFKFSSSPAAPAVKSQDSAGSTKPK